MTFIAAGRQGLAGSRGRVPQVAETAVKMRADLERLGARPIKRHRVFAREV